MSLINDVVSHLQGINLSVPGIKTAPQSIEGYPDGDIDSELCPVALVWPDSGKFYRYNPQPKFHRGVYTAEVYIIPAAQGTFAKNKSRCAELLALFIETYLNLPDEILCHGPIAIDMDVSEGGGLNHQGISQTMQYFANGTKFHGFQVSIPVIEQWDAVGGDCEGC